MGRLDKFHLDGKKGDSFRHKDSLKNIFTEAERKILEIARRWANSDIDISRTALNYDLHRDYAQVHNLGARCWTRLERVLEGVRVHGAGKYTEGAQKGKYITGMEALEKAAEKPVAVVGWVFTLPKDIDKDSQEARDFFQHTYDFLSARYGKQNVIGAHVHLDENRPHMHFFFAPIVEETVERGRAGKKKIEVRRKLAADRIIGKDKNELQLAQLELDAYITKKLGRKTKLLTGLTPPGRSPSIQKLKARTAGRLRAQREAAENAQRLADETASKLESIHPQIQELGKIVADVVEDAHKKGFFGVDKSKTARAKTIESDFQKIAGVVNGISDTIQSAKHNLKLIPDWAKTGTELEAAVAAAEARRRADEDEIKKRRESITEHARRLRGRLEGLNAEVSAAAAKMVEAETKTLADLQKQAQAEKDTYIKMQAGIQDSIQAESDKKYKAALQAKNGEYQALLQQVRIAHDAKIKTEAEGQEALITLVRLRKEIKKRREELKTTTEEKQKKNDEIAVLDQQIERLEKYEKVAEANADYVQSMEPIYRLSRTLDQVAESAGKELVIHGLNVWANTGDFPADALDKATRARLHEVRQQQRPELARRGPGLMRP